MKIGIVNNCLRGETRVAATPDTTGKIIKDGHQVLAEHGLGILSSFADEDYTKKGALLTDRAAVLTADIILSVVPPKKSDVHSFKKGQWLVCNLTSFDDKADMKDLVSSDIGVIDLGKMPRISRAQSMDILSSQSLIAGYKAATDALSLLKKNAPLLMTAAGNLFAAKALIIGAGVAGLQAISVLKRAGANVIATDIRASSKIEIESVGGKFIQDFTSELSNTDIIITAAQVIGQKPPVLITKKDMQKLPPHAVLIDLADGNIEDNLERTDIILIKDKYFERKLPFCASTFFSNNIYAFLQTFDYLKRTDSNDEIMRAVLACSDGFLTRLAP